MTLCLLQGLCRVRLFNIIFGFHLSRASIMGLLLAAYTFFLLPSLISGMASYTTSKVMLRINHSTVQWT